MTKGEINAFRGRDGRKLCNLLTLSPLFSYLYSQSPLCRFGCRSPSISFNLIKLNLNIIQAQIEILLSVTTIVLPLFNVNRVISLFWKIPRSLSHFYFLQKVTLFYFNLSLCLLLYSLLLYLPSI